MSISLQEAQALADTALFNNGFVLASGRELSANTDQDNPSVRVKNREIVAQLFLSLRRVTQKGSESSSPPVYLEYKREFTE